MSDLEIKKITDRAGTGSPNFTNGVKIGGTDSGLLAPTRTEGDTQPDAETANNGDTFYDTANDTYDILIEGAWTRVLGEGGGGGPWTVDLSNVTYDSVSFSVGSQAYSPEGLSLSPDGAKMFVICRGSDSVYQYTLSTPFDLSSAAYDSVSLSVISQDTNMFDIAFNTDGTKMYLVGSGNDLVYQYSLSTGFDLSTASYDSVSFGAQDVAPSGLAFSTDGTKLTCVGYGSDYAYQFSLSTGFDLSTASYDGFLNLASQTTAPVSVAFNSSGDKMYVLSITPSDDVYQYTLSTPFDATSASYDSISTSVASQLSSPTGVEFSSDGTKMYVVGSATDAVFQYSTGL